MWPFSRGNGAVRCGSCRGSGNCARCKGRGKCDEPADHDPAATILGADCRRCRGSGVCVGCGGSGWVGNTPSPAAR